MNHLKCPNVIFPKYSFAVRHPVYNEYTVVNDVRAFEVDCTEAFNSIFAEPSSNYEPVRTCIAVYHNKTDTPYLLAMDKGMAAEYLNLKARNCHNLVLVHHSQGHSFAVGNVESSSW